MRGATGLCLEAHDLVLSKLVAGREKDLVFARVAARHGLVEKSVLIARAAETVLPEKLGHVVAARIERAFADLGEAG
jgi:hypothetical protein